MIEYLFQFKVFDIENTIKEEKALTQLLRKSPFSVRIQENTDQKKLRINTFHAVQFFSFHMSFSKMAVVNFTMLVFL